jgi:hypothetical protein
MAKQRKSGRRLFRFPETNATSRIQRLQPKEIEHDRLSISPDLLARTVEGLRIRSDGWRESGAIWIGQLNGGDSIVEDVLFYHDLCDDKGHSLSLELSESAKFSLYANLAAQGKKLVGMIHTHPRDWVGLSSIDQDNQLCSRVGFWSLVLPHYGTRPWTIDSTGVHIRVDDGWYQFDRTGARKRVVT